MRYRVTQVRSATGFIQAEPREFDTEAAAEAYAYEHYDAAGGVWLITESDIYVCSVPRRPREGHRP